MDENGRDESSDDLSQVVVRFGEEIFAATKRLMEVYADRVRLRVRRSILQVAVGAAAAVCAIVWLSASALVTLRGLCGGVAALFGGREWAGNLVGGLLALALTGGGVALWHGLSSRRELRRLEAKYERDKRPREEHREDPTPARHGG